MLDPDISNTTVLIEDQGVTDSSNSVYEKKLLGFKALISYGVSYVILDLASLYIRIFRTSKKILKQLYKMIIRGLNFLRPGEDGKIMFKRQVFKIFC